MFSVVRRPLHALRAAAGAESTEMRHFCSDPLKLRVRMRISTLDISGITTTVRRHEALLRYARYLFSTIS